MRNTKNQIIVFLIIAILFTGCEKMFFPDDTTNTPENNFEIFWNDFNKFYPFFEIKNINWDSVYTHYRPLVTSKTSETELFRIFSNMIQLLKDYHVTLISNIGIAQSNTIFNSDPYLSSSRIYPQNYLTSFQVNSKNINYWSLKNFNIGYISINTFGIKGKNPFVFADESFLQIDEIVRAFKDKDGIIIDVRWNGGGYPANVETIVDRFADTKRLYIKVCSKNGPGRNDFSEWINYYIEPKGPFQFRKPVVVLASRKTGSAAEWFVLAMKTLPNVTIAGDTTAGGFSPRIIRELPNGWAFSLSTKIEMSADMKLYEGIGIPPDNTVQNTKTNLDIGMDSMLEKGIEIIELKSTTARN